MHSGKYGAKLHIFPRDDTAVNKLGALILINSGITFNEIWRQIMIYFDTVINMASKYLFTVKIMDSLKVLYGSIYI